MSSQTSVLILISLFHTCTKYNLALLPERLKINYITSASRLLLANYRLFIQRHFILFILLVTVTMELKDKHLSTWFQKGLYYSILCNLVEHQDFAFKNRGNLKKNLTKKKWGFLVRLHFISLFSVKGPTRIQILRQMTETN